MHLGYEYRLNPTLALFGRAARAFRLPNADERVGAGNPFDVVIPPNLNLKTQTSYDVENGLRVTMGKFNFQTTGYIMELTNEIHFIPALFANVNLDPTQRIGWENNASYQLSEDVRVRGGVTYIASNFSRWTVRRENCAACGPAGRPARSDLESSSRKLHS